MCLYLKFRIPKTQAAVQLVCAEKQKHQFKLIFFRNRWKMCSLHTNTIWELKRAQCCSKEQRICGLHVSLLLGWHCLCMRGCSWINWCHFGRLAEWMEWIETEEVWFVQERLETANASAARSLWMHNTNKVTIHTPTDSHAHKLLQHSNCFYKHTSLAVTFKNSLMQTWFFLSESTLIMD